MNHTTQLARAGTAQGIAPPIERSEFDAEMTRLRHAAETAGTLAQQLRERLSIALHPRPQGKEGNTAEPVPSSQIAGQIRDQAYQVEAANNVLRDTLDSLAL